MVWIKGQKAWNKGIDHLSAKAKKNISNAQKALIQNFGHPRRFLGHHHSGATKKRIAESMKKNGWFPPARFAKKILMKCFVCKKEELRIPSRVRKYCSYKCLNGSKKIPPRKCMDCSRLLCQRPNTKRCYSCNGKKHAGKNNHFWRGGLTLIQKLVRSNTKYIKWRSKIFKRDNWTCVKCKQRGLELNVDHYPVAFSTIIRKYKIKTMQQALKCKLLWRLKSGRTLCLNCHKRTDNYAGKGLCR